MFSLRYAMPQDHNFIMSSWRETYAKSSEARILDNKAWNKYELLFGAIVPKPNMYKRLQNMVAKHCMYHSTTLVAVWQEDPNVIVGWACGVPQKVLHYVNVKQEWQCQGIAKMLLAKQGLDIYGKMSIIYTHKTDLWREPATWVYSRGLAIQPEKATNVPNFFEAESEVYSARSRQHD